MQCNGCDAWLTVVRQGDPDLGATTGRVDCAICGYRSVWLEGNLSRASHAADAPKTIAAPKPKPELTEEEVRAKTKAKKSAPVRRRRTA